MNADPYETLGVRSTASRSEIKQAFREITAHYDANRDRDEQAEARFKHASEAHALLTSPSRRRSYDGARDSARATADVAGMPTLAVEQHKSEGPRYELMGELPQHRRTVQRMALMYLPLAIAAFLLMLIPLLSLLGGTRGAVVPLVLIVTVWAALTFQAATALRDLRAAPMFTRGQVERRWSKGGLLWLFRSHFLMVNRQVFVVPTEIFAQVSQGSLIECHHLPHTRTVLRVLLLRGDRAEWQSSDPTIPI